MIIKQGRKFPLMQYKETQCTNEWCSLLGSGKEQTTSLVSIYFFNFSVLGDRQKYAYIILFFILNILACLCLYIHAECSRPHLVCIGITFESLPS